MTQSHLQLVQRIHPHSKLLRTWRLEGGVSAQVTALEILLPNHQTKKMIIRQYGKVDLQRNHHLAADEFRLLHILNHAELPVPMPYYFNQSDDLFSTSYIVIQFIEGQTLFKPADLNGCILQMATNLAHIHQLDSSRLEVSFLPHQREIVTEKLSKKPVSMDNSLDEGLIRDSLETLWPLPQQNHSVILHGDYWPGNILWNNGKLVGIIDWEDAALGDPLADIANSRLEILWAFGVDAMNHFTHQYKSIMTTLDDNNLPYWDLWAALKPISSFNQWGLDKSTEQRMRERHHLFVRQALEKLPS